MTKLGNFWLNEDGTTRTSLPCRPEDKLPSYVKRVPYGSLQAFPAGPDRGWGMRCTHPVQQGQVVGEMVGRLLTDYEFETLIDRRYLMSFDDQTLALKRKHNEYVRYIDCREHGNLLRLMNDCEQAANCEVLYWPPLDAARGIFPTRVYLIAKHHIPALCELTWDYVCAAAIEPTCSAVMLCPSIRWADACAALLIGASLPPRLAAVQGEERCTAALRCGTPGLSSCAAGDVCVDGRWPSDGRGDTAEGEHVDTDGCGGRRRQRNG